MEIKVFDYFPEIDAFLCTKEFRQVNSLLGLDEWTPVVWIGRLFASDQDFGEHMFDNWDEREALEDKKIPFEFPGRYSWEDLLIVVSERFTEGDQYCWRCQVSYEKLPCPKCNNEIRVGADGPCHTDKVKKMFWTDVFKSLKISFDTMVEVAREHSQFIDDHYAEYEGREPLKLENQIELAREYLEEKPDGQT